MYASALIDLIALKEVTEGDLCISSPSANLRNGYVCLSTLIDFITLQGVEESVPYK